MYSGKYSYVVDEKGRIFVPVKFRRGTSLKNGNSFVVTRGFDRCLMVYPAEEWREVEKKLRSYPTSDIKSRRVVRWFTANAEKVKLDSQGRMKVPQHLLDFIELEKEVVIIGVLNRLEIWKPETYREEEKKSEPAGFDALPELNL